MQNKKTKMVWQINCVILPSVSLFRFYFALLCSNGQIVFIWYISHFKTLKLNLQIKLHFLSYLKKQVCNIYIKYWNQIFFFYLIYELSQILRHFYSKSIKSVNKWTTGPYAFAIRNVYGFGFGFFLLNKAWSGPRWKKCKQPKRRVLYALISAFFYTILWFNLLG